MAVSAVGCSCLLVWCSLQYLNHVNIFQLEHFIFVFIPLVSFLPSLILTILFLHLDRLCSCCSCTGVPGEEISVYDPTIDKRFVFKDGELVEPPKEDVETGDTPSSSFCGCCCPVQEPDTEDIAMEVTNEQEQIVVDEIKIEDERDEIIGIIDDIFDDLLRDVLLRSKF